VASLLAVPTVAFPGVSARRQAQARAAYDEAVRLRTKLEAQTGESPRKGDYEKVIRAFREVYRLNPASSKAPVALAAVAELDQEMGRAFSSHEYLQSSAQAYKFLISQYPRNPIARDALYSLGELYRLDLEDPEAARETFQTFLQQYPRSAKAAEARKGLKEIDQEGRAAEEPAWAASASRQQRSDIASQVTALRRWVGPNYTRIVIGLEGDAKFDSTRLADPDRIVLDLSNTRLSSDLVHKIFPVEDGYLHQIRVAQFKPTVTRVVLDVEKIEDYSIFTLPNPFRLIIDIHGKPQKSRSLASLTTPPPPRASKAENATALSAAPRPVTRPGAPEPSAASPGAEAEKETTTAGNEGDEAVLSTRPTETGARTLTRVLGLKIGRVVIDPGHGGHDTGTIGPTGLREKDVVLDVALRLKKLLARNAGSSVVLTRSDDTFVPLEERTAVANEKAADLFISIHANASRDRSARGVETYYLNLTSSSEALEVAARENATSQESVHQLQDLIKKIAMTEKIEESQEFARLVQHQVHDSLTKAGSVQRDRGLKKAPFVVLIGANMPSVLAEISFLTNPRDERLLRRSEHRQKIAEALYLGIARYVDTLGRARVSEQARRGGAPAEAAARRPSEADPPDF
jgi:N-acetylmuramoyl-L-alanine amidase